MSKARGSIDDGAHIVAPLGEFGERCRDIDDRDGLGDARKVAARCGYHGSDEPVEDLELEGQRAVGRRGDPLFERRPVPRSTKRMALGDRLAMEEGRVVRGACSGGGILRGHFDEIAEHIVVPDLERLDAGLVGIVAPASAAMTLRVSSRRRRCSSSSGE